MTLLITNTSNTKLCSCKLRRRSRRRRSSREAEEEEAGLFGLHFILTLDSFFFVFLRKEIFSMCNQYLDRLFSSEEELLQ